MSELWKIGERNIVADMIRKFDPDGKRMLGDDCAILESGNDYLLLTTDMITQSTHIPKNASGEDVGWYAVAINLSDIAAMGGVPLGMLFALGLPPETESKWLESLAEGLYGCCSAYDVPILGGDTKENSSITIAGTAIGRVPKSEILRRSGARPGDILAMTGKLGRGVLWEMNKSDIGKLLRIEPRLNEGRMLATSGAVTSCIDMSDGLSTSLYHLSKSGKVGFSVEFEKIPMMDELGHAGKIKSMHYGGDFELLFTASPTNFDALMASEIGKSISPIGHVTEYMDISISIGGKPEILSNAGYEHFRKAGGE